ncbi:ribonuclease T2-like isoform 2-T2 [Symphorus nematophorus]
MWCSVLPLLLSLGPAALVLLQLPDYSDSTQEEHWQDYKYGPYSSGEKPFCSWKCLLFTLQWPGAFCQSLDRETLCRIPRSVNNWTIHGLWREEWEKHGVCAACVEGLNSPLRYFQICLKLRGQFDIQKLLEDAGITPSCDRLYKVAEVHEVLAPHLGDKLEIQCVTDDQDRELWFQVKIPLSRNLTIGCDHHGDDDGDLASGFGPGWSSSSGHPCPPHAPFYYVPIDHERPQRPCG